MASSDTQCLQCGSRRIVFGEMTPGRTIGPVNPVGFRAFAARLSSVRKGVKIKSTICACAGCGLVWGHLVPDQLIEHLEKFATDETTDWLRSTRDIPL